MIFVAADIIEQAEKAAGLSDKGMFVLVVILMAGVIAFLFRDAKKTAERVATDHATSMEKLITTIDKRSEEMDQERQDRIAQMLQVIKDNTASMVSMSTAISANTDAIHDFQNTLNRISQAVTLERKIS